MEEGDSGWVGEEEGGDSGRGRRKMETVGGRGRRKVKTVGTPTHTYIHCHTHPPHTLPHIHAPHPCIMHTHGVQHIRENSNVTVTYKSAWDGQEEKRVGGEEEIERKWSRGNI